MRIFGSPVMVHVPKQKRLKWDPKSKKMLFVGFADNTKGFRFINLENKKITIACDVSFLENTSDSIIIIDNDDSNSVRDSSTNESISSKITEEEGSQDDTFHSISDEGSVKRRRIEIWKKH